MKRRDVIQAGAAAALAAAAPLRSVFIASYTKKLYVFEVDTNKLTDFDRQDGFLNTNGNYVNPRATFYDPDGNPWMLAESNMPHNA